MHGFETKERHDKLFTRDDFLKSKDIYMNKKKKEGPNKMKAGKN
jgi:hypothetical protein